MLADNSKGSYGDLSEAAVVDFVNEAYAKSVFLLDVIYQCANHKLNRIIVDILESWCVAEYLCRRLPTPVDLVKQWVKIGCKLHKDVDMEDGAPTLYCLLSSSKNVPKSTMGIILEQELLAYEEVNAFCPKYCLKMQMKITNILLQSVYVMRDTSLQKSRILIKKARVLRAHGFEALKDCIQCLSEAISAIDAVHGETSQNGISVCHELAVAYCLRAVCIEEAEPNSKKVFQDIQAGLDLWLSAYTRGDRSASDQCDSASENTMLLLYHIVDLLSLKGHTIFHNDLYNLIVRLNKWKNVPPEKCLSVLWEYRRLNHALCVSPVNEAFMVNFSKHYGENSLCIDFWINCLKGSRPLLVGFKQVFSFRSSIFPHEFYNHGNSFGSDITDDEVKETALDLISSVSVSSHSVFLASYLYYDMCTRLISSGRLTEALSYAKEAYQLRSKLLREKYKFSVELQNEMCNESGETIQKCSYAFRNLQILSSVATEVWSSPWNLKGFVLTPWNVLQSFLESTLQVGIIHEIIGNDTEAEILLLLGKDISFTQGLPLFVVSFSSVLGKLYRKKRLWDLAEKELCSAKKTLTDHGEAISCSKCELVLEVTIDLELGDLSRCHGCITQKFSLNYAENLCKQALEKLNLSEWKNSITCPGEIVAESVMLKKNIVKEVEYDESNSLSQFGGNQSDVKGKVSQIKMEARKTRKSKKASKPLPQERCLTAENNLRVTRSRYRLSQSECANLSHKVCHNPANYKNGRNLSDCVESSDNNGLSLEVDRSLVDFGFKERCICQKMNCWHCLPMEVIKSGLMSSFIHMKWEFTRRRLSLRLLTCLGKCAGIRGQIHDTHELFLQSICMLVSRNAFYRSNSSVPLPLALNLIGKEITGDLLLVERAAILYNICWFSLKSYNSKDPGIDCCMLSDIQLQQIVSWLMLAFIICREIPILFQKVSRLLAVLYLHFASSEPSSLSPSPGNALSKNHWVSYFHQASLGTHLNRQLLSHITEKHEAQTPMGAKGSHFAKSSCVKTETYNILRLAPESVEGLEEFVTNFFHSLPCTTVICISLLGDDYTRLLKELLLCPSFVDAWMLISRMNSKSQPVVILLPVDSLEEASDDHAACLEFVSKDEDLIKRWHCPWGSTIIDDVVPLFKLILEENYLSSSFYPLEDTKQSRTLWWTRRKELDQRLGKLLRDLEDSWFGPWKYLLLGEWSDCQHLDLVHEKLVHDLTHKCKVNVNESALKVILGGAANAFENEGCISEFFLKNGCYIGGVGHGKLSGAFSNASDGVKILSELALQLILDAANSLEEEYVHREPVILVLDSEIQMLPWENIPILRNQEIYRMPSVGSIFATIDRSCSHQEEVRRISAAFPFIDPSDAFYLLNPSGDLSNTQIEFENWFRNQNLSGKAGTEPTIEELVIALKTHDLFIYFGHGSGAQYIPGHEIQKLEKCAATLLMGCSSGSLSLCGCYHPRGTPFYYLLAGSPIIVANLWEVTDKDIDRFGKAVLDAWLRERSMSSVDCAQCNLVANEFQSMNSKGILKKKMSRKKLIETLDNIACKDCCNHRRKIGSFIGRAREACALPFLIGASPVCYGVPTGISNKNL